MYHQLLVNGVGPRSYLGVVHECDVGGEHHDVGPEVVAAPLVVAARAHVHLHNMGHTQTQGSAEWPVLQVGTVSLRRGGGGGRSHAYQ